MGTAKFDPLLDSVKWLAEVDVSSDEVESLRKAIERIADEGIDAIQRSTMVDNDRCPERNVGDCRSVAQHISSEYKVINGDAWCSRHDPLCEVDNSVDIVAPVVSDGNVCCLLVEGKLGCTSPRRHPGRKELEQKYIGTVKRLVQFGARVHSTLHVIVADNVRNIMRWRIGNWMRGTHGVEMVSCCTREFLECLGLLPFNKPWSLTNGRG